MTLKSGTKLATALALILLPVALSLVYRNLTAFPAEITIVTGPEGGKYAPLSANFAAEIEEQLSVRVNEVQTNGSLENLLSLESGMADLGLYQPGTLEMFERYLPGTVEQARAALANSAGSIDVSVVANLYSQPAHFFVRRAAGISSPADLEGKSVAVGLEPSGDRAMSLVILDHFSLIGEVRSMELPYTEVQQGFRDGTLDAAFITLGSDAQVFADLAALDDVELIGVPTASALATRYQFIYTYDIPAGRHRVRPRQVPDSDIQTVAAGAQLLARTDLHPGLVEEIARIALSQTFSKSNRLDELAEGGRNFALGRPDFPIHAGARNFYEPGSRPVRLFDEAMAGVRPAVMSVAIAIIVLLGWRREKRLEKEAQDLTMYP